MYFSVVVPLYNKAPYIRATIESVRGQTFGDWELIVVDDGSTDDGPDRVEGIPDPRVRLIRQQNAGVSAARNAGIAQARGEWVTFLDADDWYHPEYLAVLRALAATNPECDALATGYSSQSDEEWAPWAWPLGTADGQHERITDLPRRWMKSAPFYTSSLAVRRNRLERMQPCFPLGESSGEDLDLFFRLAEQVDIVLDARPMVLYRRGSANSLSRAAVTSPPAFAPFLARMEQRAMRGGMPSAKCAPAMWFVAQQRVTLARMALVTGSRGMAFRQLSAAWRAAGSRRWWATLGMSMLMTGEQIGRRERRLQSARWNAQSPVRSGAESVRS